MMKASKSMTVGQFVSQFGGEERDVVIEEAADTHLTDSENLLDLIDIESIGREDVKAIMETQEGIRDFAKKAKSVKKPAPVSRAQWLEHAPTFNVSLGDQELTVSPKEFKTNSFGSYGQGIITLVVDGVDVPCRVSMNVVVQNSKYAG